MRIRNTGDHMHCLMTDYSVGVSGQPVQPSVFVCGGRGYVPSFRHTYSPPKPLFTHNTHSSTPLTILLSTLFVAAKNRQQSSPQLVPDRGGRAKIAKATDWAGWRGGGEGGILLWKIYREKKNNGKKHLFPNSSVPPRFRQPLDKP